MPYVILLFLIQVGTVVHPVQNWLSCSPDGIVVIEDEVHLLEIKCPFSRRGRELVDYQKSFVCYLQFIDGEVHLKRSHPYYKQVQIQMYVLNAKKCLFFVYSSVQNITLLLCRDDESLAQAIPKLESFYFTHFLKAVHDKAMAAEPPASAEL